MPSTGFSLRNPNALGLGERVVAGVLCLCALSLLIIAARLNADPAGHGTHTQLGLAPCGWVLRYNRPCVMCGMTTAFSHAAHGRLAASFLTQPAGALGAVATAAFAWGAGLAAFTGARVDRLLAGMLRPRSVLLAALLVLAAWGYKLLTWNT